MENAEKIKEKKSSGIEKLQTTLFASTGDKSESLRVDFNRMDDVSRISETLYQGYFPSTEDLDKEDKEIHEGGTDAE